MKPAILYLVFLLSFVSCAPYGTISNPIILQPEESHDVFADLLRRNASRIDVEVIASLGEHYETDKNLDGPKLRKSVIRSLSKSGKSKDSPYGNTIYRVTRVVQARKILADTWPGIDFSDDSKLGLHFKHYPRASIALMECDNQRIFFFDENERLVAIYPENGGGC
jgi:hypothetical protein